MDWDDIKAKLDLTDIDKEKIEEIIHEAILIGRELDELIVLNIDAKSAAALDAFRLLVKMTMGEALDLELSVKRGDFFTFALPRGSPEMREIFPEAISRQLASPPSEGTTYVVIIRDELASFFEWMPDPLPTPPKSELN